MKRIRIFLSLAIWLLLVSVRVEAKQGTEKIFPNYTGIKGEIVGTNVNVRDYPDIRAGVVSNINQEQIKVVGQNSEWYRIIRDGEDGWVHKNYVEVSRVSVIPYSKVAGEEIVGYGLKFLGTPYVWGGNDLRKGVDCSGFTQEVFKAFDISLNRVSYRQAMDGKSISKNSLQAGDLVFFDTSGVNKGNVSHVGIYIGDSKFLHSDSTHGVMVSNLNSNYYTRNYVKAVRVL